MDAGERRGAGDLRERIVDAAVALLRESGVKKVAQPQVARAVGIPQGHLTYYFPKKLDLLLAIQRRFMDLFRRDLADVPPGGLVTSESTQARLLAFAARLIKDRERTRMLLGMVVEGDGEPVLRTALAEGAGLVRKLLARSLGRELGDPDVDLLLATLWGLGLQQMVFRTRTQAETDALLARLGEWLVKLEMVRDAEAQT